MKLLRKAYLAISILTVLFLALSCERTSKNLWLDELDLTLVEQIHKPVTRDSTLLGNPIIINCKEYERGIGIHPHAALNIRLSGDAIHFSGVAGHDHQQENHPASTKVQFTIIGDDKILWKSNFMGFFDQGEAFDISLNGIDVLQIWVLGDNGNFRNDAIIGDAIITYNGNKPYTFIPEKTAPYILTPEIPDSPRFNGAKTFGNRPGSPLRFQPAVSGVRPMRFSASGLPEGIRINHKTGMLFGKADKGEYTVIITASNSVGTAVEEIEIIVNDQIAITPPMGWNSWNVWGAAIDQEKVMQALNAFKQHRLGDYGWTYINIDDGWQGQRGGKHHAIQPNDKFPDIKAMIDSIHLDGYKFGIYSSPWKTTYAGAFGSDYKYMGSSADNPDGTNDFHNIEFGIYPFHEADVRQWAEWGVDYMKYDWWPNTVPHTKAMFEAIRHAGRDMVFSISNAAPYSEVEHWKSLTNLWRTTGDILDSWPCIVALSEHNYNWAEHAGPGHWNDPDMMVLGHTGIQEALHASRLSADEQYFHMSMWVIMAAPLMLGCDLLQLDDFTLSLITNGEVIEINQDRLGIQGKRISKQDLKEVYAKKLYDGSYAIGLFNKGLNAAVFEIDFAQIGFESNVLVRDVWRQQNLGQFKGGFSTDVPAHGVVLLKVKDFE